MKTILVSGASGIVGYGTLKSLRMADEEYTLIGTSIYSDSIAPAFCDVFESAPLTSDPSYIDWLCSIIKKRNIDMVIPGINDDMLAWNRHRASLERTSTQLLLNRPGLIDLCSDKWMFYEKMRKDGSQYLIDSRIEGSYADLMAAYGLPFMLKPRRGFASKGIVVVDSEEKFQQHQADMGSLVMAQPIVGNDETEYTISAFFDSDSNLRCLMGLRRKLSKEGYTEKAVVDMPTGAESAVQEIASLLKPVGPTNFQFRVHEGRLKLLEVNPRISSATSIRAAFGYNESVLAVDYFLNNKVPMQPKIRKGYAVRYTEDYIFYDSTDI